MTFAPYKDIRREFFIQYFDRALPYSDYISTGSEGHQKRWRDAERVILSPSLKGVVASWKRKLNLLVMSGTWCGDCSRQGPMLSCIAKATPLIDLRFIDNRANPDLQDELRINGAEKVPVVVSLSEDFFEVGRFGDRHLSVYRKKVVTELGAACDPGLLPPATEELEAELEEWVNYLDRIQIILRLAPMLRQRYGD